MWYPVRTRVSVRQESQFKYDRTSDSCGPDACASNKEIADSTSTVRTTAMVRTPALLIWKLRVEE
jgi:hypothetical protein